jgi:hypothetical protein
MTLFLNILSALVFPISGFLIHHLLKIEHRLTRIETTIGINCKKKEE